MNHYDIKIQTFFALLAAMVVTMFAADADISVDVAQKRIIAGHERLDRRAFFGVYHETGYGEWRNIDGKNIDEWIFEEGDMLPSRGTVRFDSYWQPGGNVDYSEDPQRPGQGYIDPDELLEHGPPTGRYVYAQNHHPDHLTILSGTGHGQWPAFMCWPTSQTHGVRTVKNYAAYGEAVVWAFDALSYNDALIPTWYEVCNESDIQNNWGWHWNAGAWDSLAFLHNAVADSMHKYWPEVKIAGATDAWPYRDGDNGSFDEWKKYNKRFIELSGDKLDCYSFHPYEYDVWEDDGIETMYEAQYRGKDAIWTKGRLEAFVDLWQNEHFLQWGDLKPFVVSEYGLLGLENGAGWRDSIESGRKFFSYIRTCNGILTAILDRPDIIDKFSAFIMSQAPYDLANGLVFARSDDGGGSYVKTRFFDWLNFWRDLKGEWLHSTSNNYNIISRSFLEDDKTLRIILHNNYKDAQVIDLGLTLPEDAEILSRQHKMLFLDEDDFVYQDYQGIDDLNSITIPAEATAMIKIELQNVGDRPVGLETNFYSDKVLVDIVADQQQTFKVEIGDVADHISLATLHFSLYHKTGFGYNPNFIKVNGADVTVPDITHSKGVKRCWKQFEISVPKSLLHKGSNSVSVQFPQSGGKITSARLAVVQSDDVALAVEENDTQIAQDCALLQNYPNPFNPSTAILYRLPAGSDVEIEIFNSAGRKVRRLLDAQLPSGNYKVEWDGVDDSGHSVSSGLYFYTLKTSEQTFTRKMLLVR